MLGISDAHFVPHSSIEWREIGFSSSHVSIHVLDIVYLTFYLFDLGYLKQFFCLSQFGARNIIQNITSAKSFDKRKLIQ